MDLTYAFRLPVAVDEAWATLSDVTRVAEAIPGASLDSIAGDVATGQLTVKIGPVSVRYAGALTVQAQDVDAGLAVLRAKGTETRGDGDATVAASVTLAADGDDATVVTVAAAVEATGRIARFGRGVLHDVGERMVGQLAEGLGGELIEVPAPPTGGGWDDDAVDAVDGATPIDAAVIEASVADSEVVEPEAAEVETVEVEMLETELGDPFEAVEPDDGDLAPAPEIEDPTPEVVAPEVVEPEVAATRAGTWGAARPATPSPASKVAPVLVGIAILWLLKKLLSRPKR